MPFTPFHFGPGAFVKALALRWFSFSAFCFAQVVIDVEVLIRMANEETALHGFFHTFAGAGLAAAITLIVGWPLCLRFKKQWYATKDLPLKEFFAAGREISFVAAITGSTIGAFSHIILDGIMHLDVLSGSTIGLFPLFEIVGPGTLHLLCFLLGMTALVIWRFRGKHPR